MASIITTPTRLVLPWRGLTGAQAGLLNTVPVASAPGAATGAASYADGFPIMSMTSEALGGVPPSGADLNGVLSDVTTQLRFACAGGLFGFDATFAAAISGYQKGAVLLLSDGLTAVISTIDGNSNDPNSDMTGWTRFNVRPLDRASIVKNPGVMTMGDVMAGVGLLIVPQSTGVYLVTISGNTQATGPGDAIIRTTVRYGTGSAPVKDASATGSQATLADPLEVYVPSLGGLSVRTPFSRTVLIGVGAPLTVGTTYWLDLEVSVGGSGFGGLALYNINANAIEV